MRSPEDRNLIAIDSLRTPAELKTSHPMSTTAARVALRRRNAIRDVLHRRDRKRQVAIVGPCHSTTQSRLSNTLDGSSPSPRNSKVNSLL